MPLAFGGEGLSNSCGFDARNNHTLRKMFCKSSHAGAEILNECCLVTREGGVTSAFSCPANSECLLRGHELVLLEG